MGSIKVILGPMFSGKSTELLRCVRRYGAANKVCRMIKFRGDKRYGNAEAVITHDQQHIDALPADTLSEVNDAVIYADVVGVDEGQFFPDLVEYVTRWADAGKQVIIAALDGTYERKSFGHVLELIPFAEKVKKLSAVCSDCGGRAAFSRRTTAESEECVIGGAEKYKAQCRVCYNLSGAHSSTM